MTGTTDKTAGEPTKPSRRTLNRALFAVAGAASLAAVGILALQVGSWLGGSTQTESRNAQNAEPGYLVETPAPGAGAVPAIPDADAQCDEIIHRWVAERGMSQDSDAILKFLDELPQGCADRHQDVVMQLRRSVDAGQQTEEDAYQDALREKRRDRYEEFLWKYPNSQYAATVRARLSSCRQVVADSNTDREVPAPASEEVCD